MSIRAFRLVDEFCTLKSSRKMVAALPNGLRLISDVPFAGRSGLHACSVVVLDEAHESLTQRLFAVGPHHAVELAKA